jgi:hypothetical protein
VLWGGGGRVPVFTPPPRGRAGPPPPPADLHELGGISGVGETKLAKYGAGVLETVSASPDGS